MDTLPDTMLIRDARTAFFRAHGLDEDGGAAAGWVTIRVGPIPLGFPNFEARRRALLLHDVHHIVAGYGTTLTGEAEVSAWELAGGCGPYAAAWLLDFAAFAYGIFLMPRRVFRAFVRGRRTGNLYREPHPERLLDSTVGDLRRRLTLERPVPGADAGDALAFAAWSLPAALVVAVPVAAAAGIAWYFVG